MKSVVNQLSKLTQVSNSLISRFRPKKVEDFNLIRRNRSVPLAYIQYVTATAIIGGFKTYMRVKNLIEGKKPVVKEYPKDTVILFQFPRAYSIPSMSPFALRLETFCRAAGIKYKPVGTTQMSSQGLIPYIKLNGRTVEDSGIIMDYLTKVYNVDIDNHLTDVEKAHAHAVLRLCEVSLFMCMGLHRFWYARNGRKDVHLPMLSYWFFSYRIYRRAWQAGYARLAADDLYEIGRRDLSAINTIIGNKKFLFSDSKPSTIDFTVFALCAQIKFTDRGPLNLHFITECKNLNRHVETMKELYWPDWEQNTQAFKQRAKQLAAATSDGSKKPHAIKS